MYDALFNATIGNSVCNVSERRGVIDSFNLCGITLGDNSFLDIKNNIIDISPTPYGSVLELMSVLMSREEIYPMTPQITKISWLETY
jgi:hypothetical protein